MQHRLVPALLPPCPALGKVEMVRKTALVIQYFSLVNRLLFQWKLVCGKIQTSEDDGPINVETDQSIPAQLY